VRGKVKEYDNAFEAVENILKEADVYLKEVRKLLSVSKITYVGSDKKRFQLEIPESVNVGENFEMSGHRKGFNRYTTQRTKVIRPFTGIYGRFTTLNIIRNGLNPPGFAR